LQPDDGTAVVNYTDSAFLTPDVNVNLSRSPNDKYSVYISVINVGRVSAKEMALTIGYLGYCCCLFRNYGEYLK